MASEREENVQNAINDIQTGRFRSIQQAADYNEVPSSTVAHRLRGRRSAANRQLTSQRFTNEEEKALKQWINDL